jgi:RNA polymerase sigma-70 factor (ECF subfamily)
VETRPNVDSAPTSLAQFAQAASGLMPTRRLDKSELRDVVRQAVAQLSERQRLAVLLSKFEEMSYADIAETMGMSAQAVKSLLSRARENLRQMLTPYIDEGRRPAPTAGDAADVAQRMANRD